MNKHKILVVFLVTIMISCTHKKTELKYMICRDSIQYWKSKHLWSDGERHLDIKCFDYHGIFKSYWVDKAGNIRSMRDKDNNEDISTWTLTSDSTLIINKIPRYKIIKYNLDTILLRAIIGGKLIDTLYRLDPRLKVINKGDIGDTLKRIKILAPI
jgi:hypothetical protein